MRGRSQATTVSAARRAAGLLLAAPLLLLAGCTLPAGVDGDLTAGWESLPEPAGFVPEVGVCHEDEHQETGVLADYRPVDCDQPHLAETVHVGEFSGDHAEREAPPSPGSGVWRSAFRDCDEGATEYLGADFRNARLWLGVTVPSGEAWQGGARWFRCDVVALDERLWTERTRSDSLAGALADEGSELRLRCFEVEVDEGESSIDRMEPASCDQLHHAQFVGLWEAPDGSYLDGADADSAEQVHRGCREQVAAYADLPVDDDLQFRTGTIADWMEEEDWDNGDRKFRCYLWLNGDEIEGSLAGAGASELPVQ